MIQLILNFQNDTEAAGEMTTLSSLAASRNFASHTASQESEKEKRMTATSGRKCLEQFEKFDRVGSWAKTFSGLLIGMEGWYSMKCRLIWKMKATKYKRLYFQLVPSTLLTDETGFGLWPTPDTIQRGRPEVAQMMKDANLPLYTRRDKKGSARQFSIVDFAIYRGMLPTPSANGERDGRTQPLEQRRQIHLSDLAQYHLLPTPMASDCGEKVTGLENQDSLTKRAFQPTGKTSQLNPLFVEQMMGFPENWILSPFLNGETNQLKHSETL